MRWVSGCVLASVLASVLVCGADKLGASIEMCWKCGWRQPGQDTLGRQSTRCQGTTGSQHSVLCYPLQ